MSHLLNHLLLRLALYPVFYWIGLAVVKALTFGKAVILPYEELGQDEDAAWWEFRIRRWGFRYWRPESMIILGGLSVLLVFGAYAVCRYLL